MRPWITSVPVGKPFEINGVPVTISKTTERHVTFEVDLPDAVTVNFVKDGASKQVKGLIFGRSVG
jgi:hypothetical protein